MSLRRKPAEPDRDLFIGVECAYPITVPAGLAWNPNSPVRSRSRLGKWLTALAALLLVLGAWQFGQGAYIQAKARLAQVLIAHAWERTLAGGKQVKPWPWADTWPVARLTMADRHVDLYVLAGADGRAIAFGPGHVFGTALPGEKGNSVIGGHRDTHLAFLRDVRPGALFSVQRADGKRRWYRVKATQVLDKRDTWVTRQEGPTRLTLVTCYPFDTLSAGGDQRYVVFANAIEKAAFVPSAPRSSKPPGVS